MPPSGKRDSDIFLRVGDDPLFLTFQTQRYGAELLRFLSKGAPGPIKGRGPSFFFFDFFTIFIIFRNLVIIGA